MIDNLSCYIAHPTCMFALVLGFYIYTTPIDSPHSSGVAKAFVKKIKCNYVYSSGVPDAKIVMRCLSIWTKYYNYNHPHVC